MNLRLALTALVACGIMLLGPGCAKKAELPPAAVRPAEPPHPSVIIHPEILPSVLLQAAAGDLHAPMQIFDDPLASGGKYVLAPLGPDNAHKHSIGGNVTLQFSVAKPGAYTLWFRTHWFDACGNSVAVVLDGADLGAVEDMVFQKWHWVPLRDSVPALAAGPHILIVRNREDGAALDQVLLTQDPDYRPTGIEAQDVPGRTSGILAAGLPASAGSPAVAGSAAAPAPAAVPTPAAPAPAAAVPAAAPVPAAAAPVSAAAPAKP